MPVAIDTQVRVDRSPEEVWARLTDWKRAHEWMSGIDALRTEGPTEIGTPIVFFARGKERNSEITALVPGREVSLTSRQGPVCATYSYSCSPDEGSARLRLVADCRIRGPLKLLGPLLRIAIRRTDGGQLRDLKTLIESELTGVPE